MSGLSELERHVARRVLKVLRRRDADYEQMRAEAARHGYGPMQCRHGMYLWCDWDVICQHCEDSLTLYQETLVLTHDSVTEFRGNMEHVTALRNAAEALGLQPEITALMDRAVTVAARPLTRWDEDQ